MTMGHSFHPRRLVSLLLAGWMAFLVVAAAVHTHETLLPREQSSSFKLSTGAGSQPGDCLVCLAAHTRAQEAATPSIANVPQEFRGMWQSERDALVREETTATRPSRAPPALPLEA